MAIKVDATSLAVGLEDGSIELWERVGKNTGYITKGQLISKYLFSVFYSSKTRT